MTQENTTAGAGAPALEKNFDAASAEMVSEMKSLRAALVKLVPETLAGEIPTAQKPRALLAPQLASYQEIASCGARRARGF